MFKYILSFLIIGFSYMTYAMKEMPFKKIVSKRSVISNIDQLEKLISKKGLKVFNRIKHSKSAERIGSKINPSELLIFGNPKIGSRLMKCNPK